MSQLKPDGAWPRPCIGYITPRINTQHGLAILRGLMETAELRRVDLLCFAGGEVQHSEDAACSVGGKRTARNTIYDLVDRASLDGLVLRDSSLGYYAGLQATYLPNAIIAAL